MTHGPDSWELDALEPRVLEMLIREAILAERQDEAWGRVSAEQDDHRAKLKRVADRWDEIAEEE